MQWPRSAVLFSLSIALMLGLSACVAQPAPTEQAPQDPADPRKRGLFVDAQGNEQALAPEELGSYSGLGSYEWPDGRTFQGQWYNGKPHGDGSGKLADGTLYQGQWVQGLPDGTGQLTALDGSTYEGDIHAGTRSGNGTQSSVDGVYTGQWLNDQPHGEGTFKGADGSEYRGQYQQGSRHGTGRFVSANASVYDGDWLSDEPSGFGVLTTADGGRHEGQWLAGQSDGYGVYEHPAGLSYKGTWKAGQRNGFGEEQRPDGSHYQGDWVANRPHGSGTIRFANGDRYEGAWKHGSVTGTGMRTYSSGYTLDALWQDSVPLHGTLRLTELPEVHYQGDLFSTGELALNVQAQEWLTVHAQRGNAAAALLLAQATANADPEASMIWYTQAASSQLPEAQYVLGHSLLDTNLRDALAWLNKAANTKQSAREGAQSGHAQAQFLLGTLYHFGERLPQDEDQAESFYQAAIANGHLPARRNLALMLATTSIDYLRDPETALILIEPVASLYQSASALDALATVLAANQRYADAAAAQAAAIQSLDASDEAATLGQAREAMRKRQLQYQNQAEQDSNRAENG